MNYSNRVAEQWYELHKLGSVLARDILASPLCQQVSNLGISLGGGG